jgi:crotonobetainyl-CoA:carnitine CoA-transferase CaiB-like acyl-CoA transferase
MGREELISDPRFATPNDRVKNNDALDAIITEWTRTRTKHEAMQQVGGASIPAGAVLDTMELQNEPTFEQRGIMQVMQHPKHAPFKMPAWPVRVDGKPPQVKASPVLGQHTDNVLTTWLGLSDAEVKALRGEGVV